jgi:8-oxo-dGTP diphosphatase
VSTVFIATANGVPKGADDARTASVFTRADLPEPLAFDHAIILRDYFNLKNGIPRHHVFSP